jgi:hypothetical protein
LQGKSNHTSTAKAIILQASLQDGALDIYHHVMMGGIEGLQKWCCSTSTPLREKRNGLIAPPKKVWLSTLWEWLSEQDVTVGIPSIAIKPPYQALSEDYKLNLQHIEEGQEAEVNKATHEARRKAETLREVN